MSGRVWVGTSGWSYDHWEGAFYPPGVPRSRWFQAYAARFPTVEINYSFYRLPSEATFRRWHEAAPEGFRFAVKGSRFITHVRRLAGCEEEVRRFLGRAAGLGEHLAVVLWQLPPNLEADPERLRGFCRMLPGGVRHAVEFRHPSWLTEEVLQVLREHNVAQVAVSSTIMPRDFTATADFVYARFHGLSEGYAHDYSRAELRPWAEFLRQAAARGLEGYAYFNNDALARAPKNAAELVALVGEAAVPWEGGRAAGRPPTACR